LVKDDIIERLTSDKQVILLAMLQISSCREDSN
jgi:hypothetical protein